MRPAAFLFDMDGTLIDSEVVWCVAILRWLRSFGEEVEHDELMEMISGRSWADNHIFLHSHFAGLPDTTLEEDSRELRKHFREIVSDPAQLIIRPTVEFLKKVSSVAPCAIVSGSTRKDVLETAKMCGIENDLEFVLGGEDYALGKPAPDGYVKAARLLGVSPEDCVVVEDSVAGVASGAAAGMKVIALDRHGGTAQKFKGCTWHVTDMSEFDIGSAFGEVWPKGD